jgi:hypothetical protein
MCWEIEKNLLHDTVSVHVIINSRWNFRFYGCFHQAEKCLAMFFLCLFYSFIYCEYTRKRFFVRETNWTSCLKIFFFLGAVWRPANITSLCRVPILFIYIQTLVLCPASARNFLFYFYFISAQYIIGEVVHRTDNHISNLSAAVKRFSQSGRRRQDIRSPPCIVVLILPHFKHIYSLKRLNIWFNALFVFYTRIWCGVNARIVSRPSNSPPN